MPFSRLVTGGMIQSTEAVEVGRKHRVRFDDELVRKFE